MRSDGETLAGIAQALWGDRSMWYLIADANGLTLSSALKAGQLLVIPNKVTNIHNNSSTWRPYNAGEAIGRTDPTVPVPPPPAKKGCGTLGTVIMAAVAVAVMATLGPVAVSALGSQVLGYAAAAAAASVASQGVGLAIGQIDSFSWKAVGQAAFGGAITGGIAAYANTAGSALQSLSGTGWVASAGKAALGSAATMALKGDWNWRNVMISAVSAGVGQAVGSVVGGEAWAQAGNGFGARLTSGLAGSLVARSLTGGNRASFATVFASTLGNAIGSSLASSSTQGQGPWSSADYRNGSDIESDNFNPASAYGYRNGMDVESDAFRPAMAYGYRNGSDVESDSIMVAREAEQRMLASNRTMLNAAERAARPEAYMSIERLPRVSVAGVSQATLENARETRRLLNRSMAGQVWGEGLSLDGSGPSFANVLADNGSTRFAGLGAPVPTDGLGTRFVRGAVGALKAVTVEPVLQARDLVVAGLAVGYNELFRGKNDAYWLPEMKSGIAEAYDNGASKTRLLLQSNFVSGTAVLTYDLTTAVSNGDWGAVAELSGGVAGGFALGKATSAYGGYGVRWSPGDLGSMPMNAQRGATTFLNFEFVSPRNLPGTVTFGSDLLAASGTWLKADTPAPIPLQVAQALEGQSFKTFGDLRAAIWRTVAADTDLNSGFSRASLAQMSEGNAPFAPRAFQTNGSDAGMRFNLHHIEPISLGGSVFDLSNLQIVSPKVHYEIHY